MSDETPEETTDERTEEASEEQASSEERPRRRRPASTQSSSSTGSRTAAKPKQTRTRPAQAKSGSARNEDQSDETQKPGPARSSGAKISAVKAVKAALEQFGTVSGRTPESVVGTRWNEDHWVVRLEVVESRRIPDTADLLAEYEVELDGSGELLSYSRMDRYVRGRPSE